MADPIPPEDNSASGLRRVDVPTFDQERAAFRERIVGQEDAVDSFASLFVKLKSGIRSKRPGPIDVKFLAGPSGVGKTEMVYALSGLLSDGKKDARGKVIKLNGGEYQEQSRHNLARLLGSPPGYIGSEDPNKPGSGAKVIFSKENLDQHRIHYIDRNGVQRSVILILVDEAEKADRSFHMAFLSILDKGQLDLGNNTTSDFSDAVIFYTSNVGNEKVEQLHAHRDAEAVDETIPEAFRKSEEEMFSAEDKDLIRQEFVNAFPPEFRGRIKETIVFNHLTREAIQTIAQIKVREVEKAFVASGIRVGIDVLPEAMNWLVKNGYSRSEGARGMEKLVDKTIYESLIKLDSDRSSDVLPTGIHRKRIVVDIKEDGSSLDFYFGDGYQLDDFSEAEKQAAGRIEQVVHGTEQKQSPAAQSTDNKSVAEKQATAAATQSSEVPQIPARFKAELIAEMGRGLDYYLVRRDTLVSQGFLSIAAANQQPELMDMAARDVYTEMAKGLDYFLVARDKYVRAGFYTVKAFNQWDRIRAIVRQDLVNQLSRGTDDFIVARDRYVSAGIGTVEEWNKLINS